MEKLISKLSELGTVLTINDGVVFTLHMVGPKISKNVFKIMEIVNEEIKDKKFVEVLKNDDDYLLLVYKKATQPDTNLLAVEFGYKACEKGDNLQKALTDYQNL